MSKVVELSLREKDAGGDVRQPTPKDRDDLLGSTRVLLLIHGYNNNRQEAAKAYQGFEALQRKIANIGDAGDYAPGWTVVKVYWPGDADYGLVSAIFYPLIVRHAPVCGQALADLLNDVAGGSGLEVAIVSHSLGCRVALEFLRALPLNTHVHVSRVVFFAAAAATEKLENQTPGTIGNAFGSRIEDAATSLFSRNDSVLSIAFPLGQSFAPGDEGFLPTALGHDRWSSSLVPPALSQEKNANAGHSDYWGWKPDTRDTCGRFANEVARQSLRLGRSAPRDTPTRWAELRTTPDARELGV